MHYDELVAKNETNDAADAARLWVDAGQAYADAQNLQKAADIYLAAIGMDPDNVEAFTSLAQLLLQDKQPGKAIPFAYSALAVQLRSSKSIADFP